MGSGTDIQLDFPAGTVKSLHRWRAGLHTPSKAGFVRELEILRDGWVGNRLIPLKFSTVSEFLRPFELYNPFRR